MSRRPARARPGSCGQNDNIPAFLGRQAIGPGGSSRIPRLRGARALRSERRRAHRRRESRENCCRARPPLRSYRSGSDESAQTRAIAPSSPRVEREPDAVLVLWRSSGVTAQPASAARRAASGDTRRLVPSSAPRGNGVWVRDRVFSCTDCSGACRGVRDLQLRRVAHTTGRRRTRSRPSQAGPELGMTSALGAPPPPLPYGGVLRHGRPGGHVTQRNGPRGELVERPFGPRVRRRRRRRERNRRRRARGGRGNRTRRQAANLEA